MTRTLNLPTCADITTGNLDSNASEADGIYPFFTCAPTPSRINNYEFDCDAILLAGNNAAGKFHLNKYKGKFNAYQRTYVITAKDGFDLNYLFYSLKMDLMRFKRIAQGSQTKFLTMRILNSFKIVERGIDEQKNLIKLISFLDSKITLNNRVNLELEEMAKTLYNYWFVQFDFPNKKGKLYKTSGGEMEYNEVLKREIPKGWEVENLASSEITQIIDVGIEAYSGSKIYLSTSEVENTEIVDHAITETISSKPSRANMQPVFNSVWFARMKDTRKLILVSEFSNEIVMNYIFSTGFAGIKVPNYALYYVWNFINDPYFEEMKNKKATGSTQKSIINENISCVPLVIPDKEVLADFNSKTLPLYKNIYKNQRENHELMQLRDFLLPMLMNGQVKVN